MYSCSIRVQYKWLIVSVINVYVVIEMSRNINEWVLEDLLVRIKWILWNVSIFRETSLFVSVLMFLFPLGDCLGE